MGPRAWYFVYTAPGPGFQTDAVSSHPVLGRDWEEVQPGPPSRKQGDGKHPKPLGLIVPLLEIHCEEQSGYANIRASQKTPGVPHVCPESCRMEGGKWPAAEWGPQ